MKRLACVLVVSCAFAVPRLPCVKGAGVFIDGRMREWGHAAGYMMASPRQMELIPSWSGPSDFSAEFLTMWDEEFLYIAVKVLDDVHYQEWSEDYTWLGDSVQFALDPAGERSEGGWGEHTQEYDLALTSEGPRLWLRHAGPGLPTGRVSGARVAVIRLEGATFYEVALPWSMLPPFLPREGATLPFSLLVNENDGVWREGWAQWSSGIGWRKCPAEYGELVLVGRDYDLGEYMGDMLFFATDKLSYLGNEDVVARLYAGQGLRERVRAAELEVFLPGGMEAFRLGMEKEEDPFFGPWFRAQRNTSDYPDGDYLTKVTVTADGHTVEIVSGFTILGQAHRRLLERIEALRGEVSAVEAEGTPLAQSAVADVKVLLAEAQRRLPQTFDRLGLEEVESLLAQAESRLRSPSAPLPAEPDRLELRGYVSPVDGATRSYWLFVPPGAAPAPVVVFLHDRGGHPAAALGGLAQAAAEAGAMLVAPVARSGFGFTGPGAADLFACLDDACTVLAGDGSGPAADRSRVYLLGHGSGGGAALSLALSCRDRFRAVAAFAPEILPQHDLHPEAATGLAVLLGTSTGQTRVSHLKVMGLKERLVAAGAAVESVDIATGDLRLLGAFGARAIPWLLAREVPERPVRLAWAGAFPGKGYFWLRRPVPSGRGSEGYVEATCSGAGEGAADSLVEVTTRGLASFELDLEAAPLPQERGVVVRVDGVQVKRLRAPERLSLYAEVDDYGRVTGWLSRERSWRRGPAKTAELGGPLSQALSSPFVLVYGTSGPLAEESREAAEAFAARWREMGGAALTIVPDVEVDSGVSVEYNLVLFGNPECNAYMDRVLGRMPIELGKDCVVLGGRRFAGTDVGAKVVYPNPESLDRSVLLQVGLTRAALRRLGEVPDWLPFDYVVFDSVSVPADPSTFLAAGRFDHRWEVPLE